MRDERGPGAGRGDRATARLPGLSLAFLLLMMAGGITTRAPAQPLIEQERENPEPAQARPLGRWTVSILGVAGQNFARTFDTSLDKGFSEIGTAAVEAERFVSRRTEIGFAVHPLVVISQPQTRAGQGRESVEAFATELTARWYPAPFSWRARPYVEIAEGPFYALRRVPSSGTRFNFLGQLGFGLTLPRRGSWAIVVGYRWVHISNAGTGEHNPSWNYHCLVLGGRLFRP